MEVYQIILMAIGTITVILLAIKAVKGMFWILEVGLKSCFRDKYPYDFTINLSWVVSELKLRGYRQTHTMDAGSDNPGVLMMHPETKTEMEVRLHAPLFTSKGNSIIVANHTNHTAIVMQDSSSEENKRLLYKFVELN